ncbi:MAG: hypothetical protein ABJB47_21645 [Actinomycetota bacterium]
MRPHPLRIAGITAVTVACLAVSTAAGAGTHPAAARPATATPATATPATATPANASQVVRAAVTPAVVLVNQPPTRICAGRKIQVGVWFQRSGGSHAYRVAVFGPHGHRIFHRHGRAPSSHWRFWKVPTTIAGTYHTVYWGHFRSATKWTPYRARTVARNC